MFSITRGKGFHMTFENGLTIIAVWDKENQFIIGKFTKKGDGSVAGYLTVEQVFEIMD